VERTGTGALWLLEVVVVIRTGKVPGVGVPVADVRHTDHVSRRSVSLMTWLRVSASENVPPYQDPEDLRVIHSATRRTDDLQHVDG